MTLISKFTDRPKITDVCDVILANCYPFWEGCSFRIFFGLHEANVFSSNVSRQWKNSAITETGWPSQGANLEGAFPSYENALKYFINAQNWSVKTLKCFISLPL